MSAGYDICILNEVMCMNTVLVCDDEKDIVSALKIYLESEGYAVECAYDGAQALALLD